MYNERRELFRRRRANGRHNSMRTNASTARASAPARLVDERRDSLHRVRRPPRARGARRRVVDAGRVVGRVHLGRIESFDARSHARADVVDAAEAAARAVKTPHSGYHRRVGVERPFFEGWYFRVTLPRERQSASLIYHVYDPDLPSSRRHGAARRCARREESIYTPRARTGRVDSRRRRTRWNWRDRAARILRGGERGRETSRMAHERGRGRDRAVERWMRGEIGALGHHRDARARMGRWRGAKMVSPADG